MGLVLIILLVNATSFGIACGAALVLREILARPWRRSAGAHWTERARLAYAPGMALLLLVAALGLVLGVAGEVVLTVPPGKPEPSAAVLLTNFASAAAGVMVVRYLWLRELWGARVTFRSWLTGFLVMLTILPGPFGAIGLLFAMPDILNAQAVWIFGAGVLVMVFFALDAELRLFRWFGMMKPAPPELSSMVNELAEHMNLKANVRVFVLEWAMVNAVVWKRNRVVGFSRALLEAMTEPEVRAVAAHELGHLLEPAWARRLKTGHTFVYLPLVPLAKYGGPGASLIALVLGVVFLLGYVRLTHLFEQRADRAESDAIADPAAYAKSMTTLHQANFAPAVMPGKQTHPHLYDRLLAGGTQPDFPRPRAPSRARPMLAVLVTTFAVMLLVFVIMIGLLVSLKIMGYEPRFEHKDQTTERKSE